MEGHVLRPLPSSCGRTAPLERSHRRSCGLHDHRRRAEGRSLSLRHARADCRYRGAECRSGQHQGDHHRRPRLYRPARRHCRPGRGHYSNGTTPVKDWLLPDALVNKAREVIDANRTAGRRLAVAESCTGGLVAAALTEIAGSSDVFEAGFVTYSNEAKAKLLRVSEEMIETFGSVSVAVAWAMAQGALAA